MKNFLTIILMSILIQFGYSGIPLTEFHVGYFKPNDTRAGYIYGLNLGTMLDESISLGLELNYFQKNFKKETTIAVDEGQFGEYIIKELRVEMTSRIIPVFAKLQIEHPLSYRNPLYARAAGGIGWEFVWNKENDYENRSFKNRFFHGFGWQLSAGLGFEMSSTTNFFIDGFYNNSAVKRNERKNELGFPVWEELNISGLGIRAGVSIVGFGLL